MGVKERKAREKENLRQAILDAAEEMFVKEGFENVTMRKIAEKIEYSPTTIYLYFKDKADLFYCLNEETFAKFLQALNESNDNNRGDPIDRIKNGMRTYIEYGLKHPNRYKLAFMSDSSWVTKAGYLQDGSSGTEAFYSLRSNVEACINYGLFRNTDIDLNSQVIWMINHGITSLLITNPNFPWVDKEKLITQAIESAIEGLKA